MAGSVAVGKAERKTSIFVLAENRLLRETLSRLLQKKGDFQILGEDCYSETAMELVIASQCDILLLDAVTTTTWSRILSANCWTLFRT